MWVYLYVVSIVYECLSVEFNLNEFFKQYIYEVFSIVATKFVVFNLSKIKNKIL